MSAPTHLRSSDPTDSFAACVLEAPDAIDALEPQWSALAAAQTRPSLFALPEAFRSWRRLLPAGTPVCVVAVVRDGRLCGLLPLMIRWAWRGPGLGVRYDYDPGDRRFLSAHRPRPIPLRQLTSALSLPATMLGPVLVCRPECRAPVIGAIARHLPRIRGWDAAVLPVEEEDVAIWLQELRRGGMGASMQPLDRGCHYLEAIASFDEVVERQEGKYRQNIRRARKSARELGLDLRISYDVPQMLAALSTVAAASWKVQGRAQQDVRIPYAGPQQAFFEHLLSDTTLSARPVMAVAMLNDAPVAVVVGAAHAGTLTTLLTFWNGEAAPASPGVLLFGALIDWASHNRITSIDFNSNNPWLRHFVDRTWMLQNVIAFAPTLPGGLLARISAAAAHVRRAGA